MDRVVDRYQRADSRDEHSENLGHLQRCQPGQRLQLIGPLLLFTLLCKLLLLLDFFHNFWILCHVLLLVDLDSIRDLRKDIVARHGVALSLQMHV